MKKSLFILLSCFSIVVFSSDLELLKVQYDCLTGKPTNEMIINGTYSKALGCFVMPGHMLDGDPERDGELGLLQEMVDQLSPDLDFGVSSLSTTIGETVNGIEKLSQDVQRLGYYCLSVNDARALDKLLKGQRKILLAELASHPVFRNHIRGLQFKIEDFSGEE